MQEVKEIEAVLAEMNHRLVNVAADVYRERNEGLDADWTNVAETLEVISSKAREASKKAWAIAGEDS